MTKNRVSLDLTDFA